MASGPALEGAAKPLGTVGTTVLWGPKDKSTWLEMSGQEELSVGWKKCRITSFTLALCMN